MTRKVLYVSGQPIIAGVVSTVWTIYNRPTDYPRWIVMRPHFIKKDGSVSPGRAELFDTLDEARSRLPRGLTNIKRLPKDDPVIVESWI